MSLLFWAVTVHIILLYSVFDIYFTSPLVRGPEPPPLLISRILPPSPPARRLVLFVADGLRATSFQETSEAPYLKYIIKNRGSWGISNTRIPTESRPGHVAIIAGFYEDPSAVTEGWKSNPIIFDSVFNKSYHTWSWGSPDIVPMFAKGVPDGHIYADYYSHEDEDFSGKNATYNLDTWVFNNVKTFFKKVKKNTTLYNKLHHNKIIFFLHLLGLDTAGHTHKPLSREYTENIKVVDYGISRIEEIINKFYNFDNKTAYIFTADHGMTDWGSHGAGSDHETMTPIIAWGSGIKIEPLQLQKNIYQADICPLIATLIGIEIPKDSVGILPISYLDASEEDKAKFLYFNMRQLLYQYNKKQNNIMENSIRVLYKPFKELTQKNITEKLDNIENAFIYGDIKTVRTLSKELLKLSLIGLEYYQNYYQRSLLIAITLSYLGWIFCLFTYLIDSSEKLYISTKQFHRSFTIVKLFFVIFAVTNWIVYEQCLPLGYHLYFSLPIILWCKVIVSQSTWKKFYDRIMFNFNYSRMSLLQNVFKFVGFYVTGLIILAMSFFYNWILNIPLFALIMLPIYKQYYQHSLYVLWQYNSVLLAIFLFNPIIGTADIRLIILSGIVCFITSLLFLKIISYSKLKLQQENRKEFYSVLMIAVMMLLAIINKLSIEHQLINKKGLPLTCQVISWTLGICSWIAPLFSSRNVVSRTFSIYSSLGVLFFLLSVKHEVFFLFLLASNLNYWLNFEYDIHYRFTIKQSMTLREENFCAISKLQRKLNMDDFRRSLIFIFYIFLSFFGIGNIASINSFDPEWVKCFITQFSPFIMAALIIMKTLIPFVCVICTFYTINKLIQAPINHVFIITLIFCDFMALYFLFLVKNTGSWMDIGISLSHYIIMATIVLFISILYCLGEYLCNGYVWSWIIFKRKKPIKYYTN